MTVKSQPPFANKLRPSLDLPFGDWRLPALILTITSILGITMQPLLGGQVSSGLIFVLGITLVGATSGLTPSLVCAVLASAIFNFFLADPVLTFRIASGADLAPPLIFTACAIVSGLLAGRLRDKSLQLAKTNLQLQNLLETSRFLQRAASETEVADALKARAPALPGNRLGLYRWAQDMPIPVGDSPDEAPWIAFAQHTFESGLEALSQEGFTGYALPGRTGTVGILVSDETAMSGFDHNFMLALAQVVGLALERARFAAVISETQANARTEELKSALLSSVSHDLRTPLTAISAAASSLVTYESQLDAETSRNLLLGIVDECDRLNRFTANLLELSRLQSSGTNIEGQVLSVNDIVRSVLQRLGARAASHDIQVSPSRRAVLVLADTALFELALTNVIQNALLYSEAGTTVLIHSEADRNGCTLTITDQGRGIPKAEQERVFERFYRAKRNDASQGSGLGLAIAKGFVEAFGGSIEIRSPVIGGRGTSVIIRLPTVEEAET